MSFLSQRVSRRTALLLLTFVLLLALGIGLWFGLLQSVPSGGHGHAGPPGHPPAGDGPGDGPGGGQLAVVSVAPVRQGGFPVQIRAVGTVTPYNTVSVVPQVQGRLLRVHVQEGGYVRAGELLAELDPRALEASLQEAQGTQAQNGAELAHARSDLVRDERLFRQDSIARQQLETQRALVRQLTARAAADQARVENARVQLGYARIHAPIAGRLGLLTSGIGTLIGPSTTEGLVSIVQTDPISVLFGVPALQLQALRDALADAGREGLAVQVWDRAEQALLATGRLGSLDNRIDPATGTVKVRARFDNPEEVLFPNQFVNVRLSLRTLPQALSVPVDAVQFGNQGNYVYVIRDGRAQVQTVTLGATTADRIQVLRGLRAGEQVVLEGIDRLREGSAVKIVGATGTAASPASQP